MQNLSQCKELLGYVQKLRITVLVKCVRRIPTVNVPYSKKKVSTTVQYCKVLIQVWIPLSFLFGSYRHILIFFNLPLGAHVE